MMNELKFSTKAGKKVYEMGNRCEGYTLRDIYGKASKAKEEAYDECLKMWNETEEHGTFKICSHNSFGFVCSWTGMKDGENIMRVETKDSSYLVWLDR